MAEEKVSHGMAAVAAEEKKADGLSAEERQKRSLAAKDQGNAAFTKKNFNLAVKCFSEAIDFDPNNAALYSNRSAAFLALAKDDKSKSQLAVEDANMCIKLKPDWGKGFSRLGAALFFQDQLTDAIRAYAQGLMVDPLDSSLVTGIASAQKKMQEVGSSGDKSDKTESKQSGENNKKYVIGIDLGTTYSCVGVWMNDGVQIIPNEDGERTLPSYVSFEEGVRYVGQSAKSRATRNPLNTVFDVKRIIGQRFSDSTVERDLRHFPFKVTPGAGDKPMIELEVEKGTKKMFAPEEVSAIVLGRIKQYAENFLKVPINDAVITVPAYFSDAQRNATKAAGAIAGLNVLRIINEPTAAALAYGLDIANKEKAVNVLIFDLGGGTFDVSLLKIQNGLFEVRATGGDTHLGGEDFDLATVEHLVAEAMKQGVPESALQNNDKVRRRLRVAAERAKRQLSVAMETEVREENLVDGVDFSYVFTRAKFESLNKAFFDRCIETVQRVLKDAKQKVEEIDEVVLVGGSTRIPRIQQMLQQFCNGKELCKSVNPDEAVAYGAAVQGAILSGQRNKLTDNLLLMDVTPLSLGIETTGRVMSVIIPRNTPIPCVKTQCYTTEENYQTEVDVCVFEGERMRTDENNLLGKFTITGIEKAKRGEPKVDVSFSLDSNGILTVSAKDQKTGAEARIEIANRSRASDAEIERMIKDAERFRKEDENRVRSLEAKNGLEAIILETLDIATNMADKKLKAILMTAAEKTQSWLEDNIETAKPSDINAKRRELEKRIESHRTHE